MSPNPHLTRIRALLYFGARLRDLERVAARRSADLSLLWEESFGDVLSAFGGFRAVERPAGASEMEEYGGELGCSSVTLASCPPDEFVRAVVVEV